MKKDRPGAIVCALARADAREALEAVLFTHSPTLGVRWTRTERKECAREERTVDWNGHAIRVKVRLRPGIEFPGPLDVSPEFDDLAVAARDSGLPLRVIEAEVRALTL